MHGSREYLSAGARILNDKKEWFCIITNAIAWFYSYPPEKIHDTRSWLCAGGKHTATCDRVAISFYLLAMVLTSITGYSKPFKWIFLVEGIPLMYPEPELAVLIYQAGLVITQLHTHSALSYYYYCRFLFQNHCDTSNNKIIIHNNVKFDSHHETVITYVFLSKCLFRSL